MLENKNHYLHLCYLVLLLLHHHYYLLHQLQEVDGSVGKLAKRVGMERTHLYRKLRSLGIDLKKGSD